MSQELRIVHFDDTQVFSKMSDAVEAAGMDWEVKAGQLLDSDTNTPIPNVVNIKRVEKDILSPTHNLSLGIHSGKYEAVQNSNLFANFDGFLQSGQVRIKSIGEMKQGRVLYAQAQIVGKEQFSVGGDGQDKVEPYIVCYNSHDGSKAFGVNQNSVRIVCQNTLMMATSKGRGEIMRLFHRKGINDKVVNIIEVLDSLTKEWNDQMDLAAKLRDFKLNAVALEKYVRQFMGVKLGDDLKGKTKSKFDAIMNASLTSAGNSPTDINLWSAYNGVTNILTHVGGKPENRAYSNRFGPNADANFEAWTQALQFANLAA